MINITTIIFESDIEIKRIESFRGAIIALHPEEPMFHNHIDNSFIYAYPLIQYKLLNRRPALVGIDDGSEALDKKWSVGQKQDILIGNTPATLTVKSKHTDIYTPEATPASYTLHNWLPLNQDNYLRYKSADNLQEKVSMLNRLLVGNILSLYKGLGVWIEYELKAEITEIIRTRTIRYKGIELIGMDVRFSVNVTLPTNCGIGKGSSKGYGIITKGNYR